MEEHTLRLEYQTVEHIFTLKSAFLAFFRGDEIVSRYWWKRVWNPVVSWFTGGYTHSEITFLFESVATMEGRHLQIYLACNIYTGESLQFEFKTKQYRSEIWELKPLKLTATQLSELYELCKADVKRGVSFNSRVYWNMLAPRFCAYDGAVESEAWCSEHNCSVLQRLGLEGFDAIRACQTHPQALYDYMRQHNHQDGFSIRPGAYDEFKKKGGFKLVIE